MDHNMIQNHYEGEASSFSIKYRESLAPRLRQSRQGVGSKSFEAMRTLLCALTLILVSGVACSSSGPVKTGTEMKAASLLSEIQSDSLDVRTQAYTRLRNAYNNTLAEDPHQRTAASEYRLPITQLVGKVKGGRSSEQEFSTYTKIVETLISDLNLLKSKPSAKPSIHDIGFLLRAIAGNPYHTLEMWAPVKETLKNQQNWTR